MKYLIQLLILVLFLISCQQKQKTNSEVYAIADEAKMVEKSYSENLKSPPPPPPPPAEQDKQATNSNVANKKKIIKDGRMGIKVADLTQSKGQVDSFVKKYGGYYDNESLNNSDYESVYTLKIRIPSVDFEHFIADLETGGGIMMYKDIDARDVTEEYTDTEGRLQTKRNYLTRYTELLKQAKKVSDILEIEEKIRGLQEEIDSSIGRLKFLDDQVGFSTLALSLTKELEFKFNPIKRDSFGESLKQSLSNGWYDFVDFILFLIKIWPLWIIIFTIRFFWKKFRYRRKGKTN